MAPLAQELAREAHLRILQQLRHYDLANLPRQIIRRTHGVERQSDAAHGDAHRGAAGLGLVQDDAPGELHEGGLVEDLEERGHGLDGHDEGGDAARRDDPAMGHGGVRAGGERQQAARSCLVREWKYIFFCIYIRQSGNRRGCHRDCEVDEEEDERECASGRLAPDIHVRPASGLILHEHIHTTHSLTHTLSLSAPPKENSPFL